MVVFPETPKLESRNCPETRLGGVLGLWELITPDYQVWLKQGLNQTCRPRCDLSNDILHSPFGGWEEVDSWLLVVGSQTASLTLGAFFAHNLGYICPNDQCKAIFDIYASRPFQWHEEHLNARCFGSCCWALNIRESRRTLILTFSKCWASPPHLAKVGLRQAVELSSRKENPTWALSPSSYFRTRAQRFLCIVLAAQIKRWCNWPAIMESALVTNHVSLIWPSIEVLKPRSWLRQMDRRDLGFRTSTDARRHAGTQQAILPKPNVV
jgi:hypothetical protein